MRETSFPDERSGMITPSLPPSPTIKADPSFLGTRVWLALLFEMEPIIVYRFPTPPLGIISLLIEQEKLVFITTMLVYTLLLCSPVGSQQLDSHK
jgi:hypothetical protein